MPIAPTDGFYIHLRYMPDFAIRTYLALLGERDGGVGTTIKSLSRNNGVSEADIRRGLSWLESPTVGMYAESEVEIPVYILVEKKSKYIVIDMSIYYCTEKHRIKFSFDDTDQTRLRKVEDQNKKLAMKNDNPYERSSLTLNMRGHFKPFIAQVEQDLGRTVTVEESFMLGSMLDMYGLERVEPQWRRYRYTTENPLRAIYAMFKNGANGKGKWKPKNIESPPPTTAVIQREEYTEDVSN